jgi:transcriptional regulator with XRE-family HTH domain
MDVSPIRQVRKQRGQTIEQVAAAVGTDAGNMSRIERLMQRPSLEMAEKLAKHFGYAITEMEILYPKRFINKTL